jgi:hypothetical protein
MAHETRLQYSEHYKCTGREKKKFMKLRPGVCAENIKSLKKICLFIYLLYNPHTRPEIGETRTHSSIGRVAVFETVGCRFEPYWVHHTNIIFLEILKNEKFEEERFFRKEFTYW